MIIFIFIQERTKKAQSKIFLEELDFPAIQENIKLDDQVKLEEEFLYPYDILKMSQENLKEYSLSELLCLDPIKNKEVVENFFEDIKRNPNRYLLLYHHSQISITLAKSLAQFKGEELHLNGLKHLNEKVASTLAQFKGKLLSLNGLKHLDGAVAKALSQWQGNHLFLSEIQQLDEGVARALSQWQGNHLSLNGVQQLDEAIAKAFSQWQGKWI